MNVITIESEAFQAIIEKIDSLSEFIDEHKDTVNHDEAWLDGSDVCRYLNISTRTLQRLRSNGDITYSTLGNKTYYTISEIKRLLESRIIRSNVESVDALCEVYKERVNGLKNNSK